jgi:hypothetical protein
MKNKPGSCNKNKKVELQQVAGWQRSKLSISPILKTTIWFVLCGQLVQLGGPLKRHNNAVVFRGLMEGVRAHTTIPAPCLFYRPRTHMMMKEALVI